MGICQSADDESKKKKSKSEPQNVDVVEPQPTKETEPPAAPQEESKPAVEEAKVGADIDAFFEDGDEPNEDDPEQDLENEDEEDSSDEFEMDIRKINPKNLENRDELGDDFGIGIMDNADMAGNPLFQLDEAQDGECFMAVSCSFFMCFLRHLNNLAHVSNRLSRG